MPSSFLDQAQRNAAGGAPPAALSTEFDRAAAARDHQFCGAQKINKGRKRLNTYNVLVIQDPQRFRKKSRPLRIGGHSTTVRLEEAFWQVLDEMATLEGVSTPKLIAALYHAALEHHSSVPNFSSFLRTLCLLYRETRTVGQADDA